MTAMHQEVSKQKLAMDETMTLYRANLDQKESLLKESCGEIEKGNAIISKLQTDSRQLKSKLKLKDSVIQQQEETLISKQKELENVRAELEQKNTSYQQRENKLKTLEEALKDAHSDLEKCEEKLKSNEQGTQFIHIFFYFSNFIFK